MLQHGHELLAVAFRPDGKEIATASLEGHIHFWDPLEGSLQVFKACNNPHLDPVQAIHDRLAQGAEARTVRRGRLRVDGTYQQGGQRQTGGQRATAPQGCALPPWHTAQMAPSFLPVCF